MKITAYLFNFFFLSQFAFLPNANAQVEESLDNDDKNVTVHIKQNVNGEVSESTSTFSLEDLNLSEMLKELNVDLKELEGKLTDELKEIDMDIEIDIEGLEDEIREMKKVIRIEMDDLEGEWVEIEKEMDADGNHNVLIEKKMSNHNKAFLGVLMDEDYDGKGVRVDEVVEGSAAEQSGLQAGDVLTQINKKKINSAQELIEALSPYKSGDEIGFTYLRDGEKLKGSAELTAHKEYKMKMSHDDFFRHKSHMGDVDVWVEKRPFLGVTTYNDQSSSDEGQGQVKVMNVIPNSAAEAAGLQVGDVIQSVNSEKVEGVGQFADLIRKHDVNDEISLSIERNDEPMEFKAVLKERTMKMMKCFKKPDSGNTFEYEFKDGEDMTFDFDFDIEEGEGGTQIMKFKSGDGDGDVEKVIRINIEEQDGEASNPALEQKEESADREEAEGVTPGLEPSTLPVRNLSFFPNPNEGEFKLKFNLDQSGDTRIKIYDTEGRVVYTEDLDNFSGQYENMIDISESAKGTYLMQIRQGEKILNEQIVIQ